MCTHGLTVQAAHRYDPTRTTTLRQQFEADVKRRFKRVSRAIREAVGEEDGFGLKANRGQFEFPRSDDKISAFMDWLQDMEYDEVLEVRRGVGSQRSNAPAWTDLYIQSAYQKGLAQSAARMRKQGADVAPEWVTESFTRPFHVDRVALAYTRTFRELEGITDAMDQQISRVLAEGLSEGRGPMDIARSMIDRVEKVGITRARMLARTEVIRSHADASLNVYEEADAIGVQVEAEFSTANDDQVCEECRALEGKTYPLSEARGMIPVHPNCRCAFIPVLPDPRKVRLH